MYFVFYARMVQPRVNFDQIKKMVKVTLEFYSIL